MGSENLIGVLAIATIGLVLVFAIYHFGNFVSKRENREAAKNTLVRDEKSATTKAGEGQMGEAHAGRTMKERLDDSLASAHPDDPGIKGTR